MKARVSRQPALDFGMLVGGVVVADQVELPIQRDGLVDQTEKVEPFLVAMHRRYCTHAPLRYRSHGRQNVLQAPRGVHFGTHGPTYISTKVLMGGGSWPFVRVSPAELSNTDQAAPLGARCNSLQACKVGRGTRRPTLAKRKARETFGRQNLRHYAQNPTDPRATSNTGALRIAGNQELEPLFAEEFLCRRY